MSIKANFLLARENFSLDVDLEIPDKGITTIFGPSGCGKTTLLRAIAGLEKCDKGSLVVGEQVWQNSAIFLPPHKRPVGYVFQEPSLFNHLNIQGNIEYGLKRLRPVNRKVSLDKAISLLGISHLLQRKPHQLSGGEQQRVAIARALAISPAMLLMDEPLAALDMNRKQEILPYLESLQHKLDIPILYVTHSRDEIARLSDHLVLLEAGRVQATGSIRELFSRLDLPLAHQVDTEMVIEGVITGHDDNFQLSFFDFSGGQFTIAKNTLEEGSQARLQVLARDVSITLAHQKKTSILNIFPAIVEELADEGKAQTTVRLKLGSAPLLSRITRKSASELGLKPGKQVYAQVKSVALLQSI